MKHVDPEGETAAVQQPVESAKDPSVFAAAPAEDALSEMGKQLAQARAGGRVS